MVRSTIDSAWAWCWSMLDANSTSASLCSVVDTSDEVAVLASSLPQAAAVRASAAVEW